MRYNSEQNFSLLSSDNCLTPQTLNTHMETDKVFNYYDVMLWKITYEPIF